MLHLTLIDDHSVFIEALASLIEQEIEGCMIESYSSGQVFKKQLPLKNLPDAVIIDVNMPEINGIELTKIIRKYHNQLPVVILSMYDDTGHIQEALAAGVNGYVVKSSPKAELLEAIKTVVEKQEKFLCRKASQSIFHQPISKNTANQIKISLTNREQAVLKLLAQGKSTGEISTQMQVGIRTIDTYRQNLLEKFSVPNVASLISKAYQLHFLT